MSSLLCIFTAEVLRAPEVAGWGFIATWPYENMEEMGDPGLYSWDMNDPAPATALFVCVFVWAKRVVCSHQVKSAQRSRNYLSFESQLGAIGYLHESMKLHHHHLGGDPSRKCEKWSVELSACCTWTIPSQQPCLFVSFCARVTLIQPQISEVCSYSFAQTQTFYSSFLAEIYWGGVCDMRTLQENNCD